MSTETDFAALLDTAKRLRIRARRLLNRLLKPSTRDNDAAFESVTLELREIRQRTHDIEDKDRNGPIGVMMRRLRTEIAREGA